MRKYGVYLNGGWLSNDDTVTVVNPASGTGFAKVATVGRDCVAQAIADAHTAFPAWRAMTGAVRGALLEKVAGEIDRRREEIARIITLENGKPIWQSQSEVAMAIDHMKWFAEEARRIYGRVLPHQAEGKRHLVIKSPIGVVGAITPWNFPLMLAVRKVAPALAAGCPVILKPSSRTPLSAVALAECIQVADLPRGAFQLVVGKAADIAAEFLENPLCRKITFTGSTRTGRELIAGSAKLVKPLTLELGGHAPLLVFEDCDLTDAVHGAMNSKFRNTGQACTAVNRIYVHRSIYQPFLDSLVAKTKTMKVGDGMDPDVQIGPMISEAAVVRATEHVSDALKGGAKLLCGGNVVMQPGFFLEPTILSDVPRASLCMFEETFAPIAPVTVFDTEAEAIQLANNSQYGLSAYAFTNDLRRMFRLAENLEAGVIGINDTVPLTSQAPFGGMKQSGWGRELGAEGIEAFLETKHISIGID